LTLARSARAVRPIQNAFSSHQNLTARNVAELKKPRFSLGSTLELCLGAAGAGTLLGMVIQE
jgi:hypothetical protein